MSASNPNPNSPPEEDADELLNADDAAEEIPDDDDDDDQPMEDDDDAGDDVHEELQFQNDSAAHFDGHTDSIFCIAQHPVHRSLIVTGGGDDVAYLFDASLTDEEESAASLLLPRSYESNPPPKAERRSIPPLQKFDGHTDSVNAVTFTQPSGEYILTAGLDGKLRAWSSLPTSTTSTPTSSPPPPPPRPTHYTFVSESSEVQEINWLAPCPSLSHPNSVALGANDGSVWVYTVNVADKTSPLTINQAYYLHTETCTAGAWTPDGNLLATVSEDSSFHVHDVWGEAAKTGFTRPGSRQAIVSLTASDQRFAVQGGLFSVAISPGGTIAAVGGAEGNIRIIGLPRAAAATPTPASAPAGPGAKGGRGGSAKNRSTSTAGTSSSPLTTSIGSGSPGTPGTVLASLQSQTDIIETLSFSSSTLNPLLAAGSVDGTIALFDLAHRFALRRHIPEAHDGFAVVKLEFVAAAAAAADAAQQRDRDKENERAAHYLTSAGMDGVVRRWDVRGPNLSSLSLSSSSSSSAAGVTSSATGHGTQQGGAHGQGQGQSQGQSHGHGHGKGLVKEWRGHRGDGEGGGVLGFVQGDGGGERIVTAGDDGVALVFVAASV